jgi:putative component of membrane protein insertase Oxa1/YidC/SpoIIIJ protein YidD
VLTYLIRGYQRWPWLNRCFRLLVAAQHKVMRPELRPCPFAGQCSSAAITQINAMGAVAAVPLIASRIAHCGPGLREERFQWCISAATGLVEDDGLPHYHRC